MQGINEMADEKYEDARFEGLLRMLARKNSIPNVEYEDFRHDVFLEALESYAETDKDYDRAAYRVARKYGRVLEAQRDPDGNILKYSFDENRDRYFDDIDGRYNSPLWEDMNII